MKCHDEIHRWTDMSLKDVMKWLQSHWNWPGYLNAHWETSVYVPDSMTFPWCPLDQECKPIVSTDEDLKLLAEENQQFREHVFQLDIIFMHLCNMSHCWNRQLEEDDFVSLCVHDQETVMLKSQDCQRVIEINEHVFWTFFFFCCVWTSPPDYSAA